MEWQVHHGSSALSAVTGDSETYAVHLLAVPATADLHAALAEFWRCLLVEGPKHCKSSWDVIHIELCSDAGMFTAVFTTSDRRSDQPGVFKLTSEQIENEYLELLESQLGAGTFVENFESEHESFVTGYWQSLVEVTQRKQIQTLLRELHKQQPFRVFGALIDSTELLELEVFGPARSQLEGD